MKFQFFIAILIVVSSSGAFAQSRCLQQATNDELLNEISTRMGVPAANAGELQVSFSCVGNAEVSVTAVNLYDGRSLVYKFSSGGDWTRCTSDANLLNKKLGDMPQTRGKVFALCGGQAELVKVLVSPAALAKEISRDTVGDWSSCISQANRVNLNL